jgi:hypothetical protein
MTLSAVTSGNKDQVGFFQVLCFLSKFLQNLTVRFLQNLINSNSLVKFLNCSLVSNFLPLSRRHRKKLGHARSWPCLVSKRSMHLRVGPFHRLSGSQRDCRFQVFVQAVWDL